MIDVDKFLKSQEPRELAALEKCIEKWKEPMYPSTCKKNALGQLKNWKQRREEILNANNL